jgi:2-dehydro-3-deoxyglucarate aldolase/4-hydroxy-2-oxoheptanedioate aldolase
MKKNRFREVAQSGQTPVGHMIWEFGTRGIAKILESTGIDFVLIDMEHTGFDTERVADLIAWLKATDIGPFVRVPQRLYHFLARSMDAGALGVMVANVETAEQARQIVDSVKYAPLGNRGLGLGGSHNNFIPPDPVAYMQYSNSNTTVICQIESVTGLRNCEAIGAVPGVDVLWVGHFDLTQSMGIPAQFQHPQFLDALRAVSDAAKRNGILAGIQPSSLDQARQWMALGYNVISWATDVAVYRTAVTQAVHDLRAMSLGTTA